MKKFPYFLLWCIIFVLTGVFALCFGSFLSDEYDRDFEYCTIHEEDYKSIYYEDEEYIRGVRPIKPIKVKYKGV